MGNRLLFDSLLSSGRWNDLGHAAQCFYIRLVLVVDDFGCFDGRESVIAAQCYPTSRTDVAELLAALHGVDLITRYSNAGKPYVAIMRWHCEVRGKRKFPAPPINIDAPDLRLAGKFGRPIGWKNPGGSDQVSVLLDAQMRPTVPQPREWRLVNKDYAPDPGGDQPLQTMVHKPSAPVVDKPYSPMVHKDPPSGGAGVGVGVGTGVGTGKVLASAQASDAHAAPQHGAQGLQPTATPPTNGKVELTDSGEWRGVSEAQRLRWQDMFADMSIPDQLARAGAWLLAHDAERRSYERSGELEQFLIRWLLREARASTAPPAKAH